MSVDGLVLEVALHHHVAAEHHLAHRLPVGGDRLHRLGVEDVERLERVIAHALARLQMRLGLGVERVPLVLPVVDHGGAVDLGQAVEMGDLEARLAHRLEHRGGRRRGGGEEAHEMRQRLLLVRARIEQHRHDDRRAAEMGDLVLGDQVVHRLGAHLAQADVHARLDADRPGEAPAVAMEHRQRPQIDRMAAHVGGDDVADREQVGAAVVVDDALGVAGRARGVVQRNGVPFVERGRALIALVALGDERLVFDRADPLARAVVFGIVVVDDQRPNLGELQRRANDAGKLAVDDQRLRLAVVEHEGDRRRVEAGVERVEHRAAHRHAVVAFEHRRRVGEHDRDRVAARDPAFAKRRGEPFRAGVEVAIVAPEASVHDRQPVREHLPPRARGKLSGVSGWKLAGLRSRSRS